MKFLVDYPTLDKLEAAYPGIRAGTNLNKLISENTLSALDCVPRKYHDALRQKYSPSELLFGLRILFGTGKGRNHQYSSMMLHNGVIVKYGCNGDGEPSRAVHNRIACCVRLAHKMAREAWCVTQLSSMSNSSSPSWKLIQSTLAYHFKVTTSLSANNYRITETYKRIYAGLSNLIIIAERPAGTSGAGGYVDWCSKRMDRQNSIPSPFQTSFLRKDDAQDVAHWKTLSKSERNATARPFGVEPSIEAMFMSRSRSIHIDFNIVENKSPYRYTDVGIATIILHEASHKFGNTEDFAYCYQIKKYLPLKRRLRLINADSYAVAAASLHCKKLILAQFDKLLSRKNC